jgi:hypothetical protein
MAINKADIIIKDTNKTISYTKIDKLISALYMVTDILEKDEPIKGKLRLLGVGLISDINSFPNYALSKIREIMSFLKVASSVGIVSEMNVNILMKEFSLLNESIVDFVFKNEIKTKSQDISELFLEELPKRHNVSKIEDRSVRAITPTRIGVQKGSTLMQALSDKTNFLLNNSQIDNGHIFKLERRNKILKLIKDNNEGLTIKDIKASINSQGHEYVIGEKTLQRELVSLIKDGVLYKTGDKRWSRYFVKN